MNKVVITIIQDSPKITRMARAADIFEEGKICGMIQKIDVNYKSDEIITWQRCQKLRDKLATEKDIVFAHIESIHTDESIQFNMMNVRPYVDQDVRVVSDGKRWYTMTDFLKSKKISHTVTDDMYIRLNK